MNIFHFYVVFVDFFFTLPHLYIALCWISVDILHFSQQGKKAINTILVDLESSERGLQLWFFLFLDYFLL